MSSKTFPTLNFETELWARGPRFVIGIDEVGRGAIAGPVAVGVAVIDREIHQNNNPWPEKLRDSKLLSESVREEIFEPTKSWVTASAVGQISASEIDRNGIVDSLARAGAAALVEILFDSNLREQIASDGAVIILDGSHNWIGPKSSGIEVVVKTKADRDCVSVAAASVIAKVTRDRYMIELAKKIPGFGLDSHKGYASAAHISAVRELGPSGEHRLSWLTNILAGGAEE
ncbi:MAG: ribonuclease HII [Rhodoluna sp.]